MPLWAPLPSYLLLLGSPSYIYRAASEADRIDQEEKRTGLLAPSFPSFIILLFEKRRRPREFNTVSRWIKGFFIRFPETGSNAKEKSPGIELLVHRRLTPLRTNGHEVIIRLCSGNKLAGSKEHPDERCIDTCRVRVIPVSSRLANRKLGIGIVPWTLTAVKPCVSDSCRLLDCVQRY